MDEKILLIVCSGEKRETGGLCRLREHILKEILCNALSSGKGSSVHQAEGQNVWGPFLRGFPLKRGVLGG